jgi:hypothetical protein
VGTSQSVSAISGGSANPSEPVPASLSRQAPVKALPPTVAQVDAALGRLGIEIVRAAAGRRRRERGTSNEMFAFLTSYGWADALAFDGVMGLGIADAWQLLVGIGAYCSRHLAPFDGDDVNGPFCAECEHGVPARTSQALRVDCDPCGGSCEGRCDAGAGTWPERQAARAAIASLGDFADTDTACPTCQKRTVERDSRTAPWCSTLCADIALAGVELPAVGQ